MSLILALGLVLVFGSFMGRMAEKIRLSSIVGFLACGIVIGSVWPGVTQFITDDGISTFTTIGLAMIAFMIGEELYLPKLKLMGKETLKVVFIQALVTMLLVATVTVVLGNSVSLGLILGAIAAATAPATAFMVTKKYRTSGQLTQMLLPIVALDDAVSIVFFTVAMAVGTVVEGITGGIASAIGLAAWELFGSGPGAGHRVGNELHSEVHQGRRRAAHHGDRNDIRGGRSCHENARLGHNDVYGGGGNHNQSLEREQGEEVAVGSGQVRASDIRGVVHLCGSPFRLEAFLSVHTTLRSIYTCQDTRQSSGGEARLCGQQGRDRSETTWE